MRAIFAAVTILGLMSTASHAQDGDAMQTLTILLGSEQLCKLSYKPASVKTYVEENISADDGKFMEELDYQIWMRKNSDRKITPSETVARCAQVERLAKHHKFID